MECHQCGATISEKAADCPHCGTSVRDPPGGGRADEDGREETGDGTAGTDPVGRNGDRDRDQPERTTGRDDLAGADGSGSDRDWTAESTDRVAGGEATGPGQRDDAGEREPDTGRAGDAGRSDTGEEPAAGGRPAGVEGEPTADGERTADRAGGVGHGTDAGESALGRESGVEHESGPGEEAGVSREPGVGHETGVGREPEGGSSEETEDRARPGRGDDGALDPVEAARRLPLLSGTLAGVVTAAVLAVLAVVVAVVVPDQGADPVSLGAVVLLDLHFATSSHVTPAVFEVFQTANPPNASLGLLYVLPPLSLYTASKFVVAYNLEETAPLWLAGAGGALVAVGYFPAMAAAYVLAPGGPGSRASLLPAVLLAGTAYPVVFGGIGGLAAGALSGSERRIGTLYGVVAFFLLSVGAVVLTVPALRTPDLGVLVQVHAALVTVVAVNGFSLGAPDVDGVVLLAYPMVALAVFAAGFLRAWNAGDVAGPGRGAAKGLSPAVTYFTLLALLATVLPVLADPWVVDELGLSAAGETLVESLVRTQLGGIGRYVAVVFGGTLAYAVGLGGLGGTIAGALRDSVSGPG